MFVCVYMCMYVCMHVCVCVCVCVYVCWIFRMKLKSRRTVGERWICGCWPNMVIRRDTLGMSAPQTVRKADASF